MTETLFAVVGGLFILSMISFSGFLAMINKDYLHTFYDYRTGRQFVTSSYKLLKTDKQKWNSFSRHRSLNEDIEPELMKWLNSNWDKWEDERPDFFTAAAISDIPGDMLPVKVLLAMGGMKGRKQSIAEMKEDAKKPQDQRVVRGADLKIIHAAT